MVKKNTVVAILATFCLTSTLFIIMPIQSQPSVGEYDPWTDLNGDGAIDIFDIVQVAIAFGSSGTPIAKASIEYDSGWINITDKRGQYLNIVHNLNSSDIMVDITGKEAIDSGAHQRGFGLEDYSCGWNRTYGEEHSDFAYSLVQTIDGGYAIAGQTYISGATNDDFWLVKVNADGKLQWSKNYGGTNNDRAYSLIQTSDWGYAMAGCSWSYGLGEGDFWLIKTDASGNMQWNKTYGGISTDEAHSVVQTIDGGYALVGWTGSFGAGAEDLWLVKTDKDGNVQWNKTCGGEHSDIPYSLIQTSDGGYAVAGLTYPSVSVNDEFWLVKMDSYGNVVWTKTYGEALHDRAYSLIQTDDGGYALAGITGLMAANSGDFWLVKTDSIGNAQWNRTYGGTGYDKASSVVQTNDGGYALVGATWSFGEGDGDFWLVKTDEIGKMQWNRTYGGMSSDFAYSLVETVDGGYAIAGWTGSFGAGAESAWLVKTDVGLGLAWTMSTPDSITLYRGATDPYWNFVRVRIWKPKTP